MTNGGKSFAIVATLIGMGVALWYLYSKDQSAAAAAASTAAPQVNPPAPSSTDATSTSAAPATPDNSALAQSLQQLLNDNASPYAPTVGPNGQPIIAGGVGTAEVATLPDGSIGHAK